MRRKSASRPRGIVRAEAKNAEITCRPAVIGVRPRRTRTRRARPRRYGRPTSRSRANAWESQRAASDARRDRDRPEAQIPRGLTRSVGPAPRVTGRRWGEADGGFADPAPYYSRTRKSLTQCHVSQAVDGDGQSHDWVGRDQGVPRRPVDPAQRGGGGRRRGPRPSERTRTPCSPQPSAATSTQRTTPALRRRHQARRPAHAPIPVAAISSAQRPSTRPRSARSRRGSGHAHIRPPPATSTTAPNTPTRFTRRRVSRDVYVSAAVTDRPSLAIRLRGVRLGHPVRARAGETTGGSGRGRCRKAPRFASSARRRCLRTPESPRTRTRRPRGTGAAAERTGARRPRCRSQARQSR